MKNLLDKMTVIKQNYYRDLMMQMQKESYRAAATGDHERSVVLYYKYLHYKHKYIKVGGKP